MREFLLVCLTVAISALFAVLLVEASLRIIKRDIAFQPDPELIRSLRPNITRPTYTYETEDNLNGRSTSLPDAPVFAGYVYTNNVGFRMKGDIGPKRTDERRLLLLGDSFTEGLGARTEDRFANVLQERLDAERTGSERWLVINAGIQNGTPSQYVLQLRRYLGEFEPDIVVVVTGANDISDDCNFERAIGFEFDEDGLPLRLQTTHVLTLLKWSYVIRYFHTFVRRHVPVVFRYVFPPANPEVEGALWQRFACTDDPELHALFRRKTGKYLRGLKRMTEGAGAAFGVVVIHYLFAFADEPYYEARFPAQRQEMQDAGCFETHGKPYDDFMASFLEESGIAYRSTYEPFIAEKRRTPQQKLWNFYDYHFSRGGNAVTADVVHDLFLELEQARH